jgi:hypothetical protein
MSNHDSHPSSPPAALTTTPALPALATVITIPVERIRTTTAKLLPDLSLAIGREIIIELENALENKKPTTIGEVQSVFFDVLLLISETHDLKFSTSLSHDFAQRCLPQKCRFYPCTNADCNREHADGQQRLDDAHSSSGSPSARGYRQPARNYHDDDRSPARGYRDDRPPARNYRDDDRPPARNYRDDHRPTAREHRNDRSSARDRDDDREPSRDRRNDDRSPVHDGGKRRAAAP